MVATPSPGSKASADDRKRKMTLERARAVHLSRQLQLRLQYARLKVEHGWHKQNLNEVENLYFHHSHLRGPRTNSQTIVQAAPPGSYKPSTAPVFPLETSVSQPLPDGSGPSGEIGQDTQGNIIRSTSGTPSPNIAHPNLTMTSTSVSSKTPRVQPQTEPPEVRRNSPTDNSSLSPNKNNTSTDVDQQTLRPSTPNNPISLVAAASAYPSPSYNPPHRASHTPASATTTNSASSSTSGRPSISLGTNSASTSTPTSSSSTVPSTSLPLSSFSSFSWSTPSTSQPSTLRSQPTLQSYGSSSSFTSNIFSTSTSDQVTPAPTLTYDSFWSSHSAAKSVRASFSGFSGRSLSTTGTTGSLSSLGSGTISASTMLSLLQKRSPEGQFSNVTRLGAPFEATKVSNGVLGSHSGVGVASDNVGTSGNVPVTEPAVGTVGIRRQ